jgi:RHS repeat-associated protein
LDDQLDYYDIYVNDLKYSRYIVSYDEQGNPLEITNIIYINLDELEEDIYDEDDVKVYGHATLEWEARTLMSISIYDDYNTLHAVINYTYNADGYRTSKTITEGLNYKQYTYDLLGSNVIHEEIYSVINLVQTTRDIYYTYDFDGTLVSFNLNSEDYFYINNIQGDIVAIVDQDGNVVVKYDYDSYGNIIQKSIDPGFKNVYKANSYTYRGYRYDIETGLYYLQSRYYNPEIGRFISSDGLLGQQGDILSTNMYAYCENNPVNYSDPSGYLLKTINEYSSDGSGVVDPIQTVFTIEELYFYYLYSDEWEINREITLNSYLYYDKLDTTLFGLGVYMTIFIKSVPTELSLALIFVDFAGRILDLADTSINYWIAVTFTRKCDGYISKVFYVEIYYNNGFIYPKHILANPPFGVY